MAGVRLVPVTSAALAQEWLDKSADTNGALVGGADAPSTGRTAGRAGNSASGATRPARGPRQHGPRGPGDAGTDRSRADRNAGRQTHERAGPGQGNPRARTERFR